MFWEYFANILLPLKKKAFVGNARLNRETFISAAMFPALVRSGYFVQAEQWRGAWWCACADSREQSVFSFYSYSYVVYPLTTPSNNDCWWSTLFSVSRSFHSPLERERSVIGAETFRANHADHVSLQEPIVSWKSAYYRFSSVSNSLSKTTRISYVKLNLQWLFGWETHKVQSAIRHRLRCMC